jgi:hypothetical protein
MADNALMKKRPGRPRVHPQAQAIVHDLAKRGGVDIAREIQSLPADSPREAYQAVRARALEAATKQAATDMELESIDQIAPLWGIPSPFSQGDQPMKLGGPGDPNYDRDLPEEMPGPRESGYGMEMSRQTQNPGPAFEMYDRMTTSLENEQPGAERAYGKTQGHLRNYYGTRGNALMRNLR